MLINNIVDIHTHILPGVDDGAKNTTESLRLLKDLKMQGVECVYATPHFYVERQDFGAYISKVDASYDALMKAADGMKLPEIRRGCEVRLFRGVSTYEDVKKLRLQNSHYLLVELPHDSVVENWMIRELYNMQFTLGLKPIVAHIERYFGLRGFENLFELVVDEGVRTQITSSALMSSLSMQREIYSMVREGRIHFIASDAHSMNERKGMFLEANAKLKKKCGERTLQNLYCRSNAMIHFDDGCEKIGEK